MTKTRLNASVAVVGLGLMGTAITERLLELGYQPSVWNRTRDKAESLIARGAVWSDRPFTCHQVIISLFSSDVVAEVLLAHESDLRAGQILIDTTTGNPEHSEQWAARLQARGVGYLDAPISGSSEVTRRGEATVMVSGDRRAYECCEPLWPVLGRQVFYVGESGSAARMKLVTNLVLGLNRAALAEGLVLARLMGLNERATLDVLKGSPAYSRQMDAKGLKMIDAEYSVQAKLSQHLKDVRLMLESAAAHDVTLSLTEAHRLILERAEGLGFGDADNSAVIEAMRSPPA
ncbi:NAD-binding protein [bacterium]|nr:NAD-binding protein [bacterium]